MFSNLALVGITNLGVFKLGGLKTYQPLLVCRIKSPMLVSILQLCSCMTWYMLPPMYSTSIHLFCPSINLMLSPLSSCHSSYIQGRHTED